MVHADMGGAARGPPGARMSARRSTKQPRGRAAGASRGGARQRWRPLSGCVGWQSRRSQFPKKFSGLKCRFCLLVQAIGTSSKGQLWQQF